MIVRGEGGSPALDHLLGALADAVAAREDLRPDELWVLGTPRARDWPGVVGWEGAIHALLVPHGAYHALLAERSDRAACFAADAARLGGDIATTLPVPAPVRAVAATAAPAGTPLGEVGRRRSERGSPPERAGVVWVNSDGAAAVADAASGWHDGRAVVVLTRGPLPALLGEGAVVGVHSALEADEATSFLEESPPIVDALARAGSRRLRAMPSAVDVATAFVLGVGGGN